MRFRAAVVFAALAASACSSPEPEPGVAPAVGAPDWAATPRIDHAAREGAVMIVSGQADPGGRVALRGADGQAFAVSADDQGRFTLRFAAPDEDLLLRVGLQRGQTAVAGPEHLAIARDPRAPVLLTRQGAGSRRLDVAATPGARLETVDSDGQMTLISGRAAPGARVSIGVEGGSALEARADGRGLWTVSLAGGGPLRLSLDGVRHDYPGHAVQAPGLGENPGLGAHFAPVGAGWRLIWGDAAAVQSAWSPTGAAGASAFTSD
jgi:hypothetical protein